MAAVSSRLRRLGVGPVAAGLAVLLGSPAGALGQEGCEFGSPGNDVYTRQTLPNGGSITYVSNPYFVCADGVRIWADSAVAYSAQAMSHLIGSVRYVDRTRELRSDDARYFSNVGRLQAEGHVFVSNTEDGSQVEHGDLVYLRRTRLRDEESMTVTTGADGVRPRATVRPIRSDTTASVGEAPSPYTVVGDRIVLRGNAHFSSVGSVEITRDSLVAFADSAEYEEATDRLVLEGTARVESASYVLVGRTITLGAEEGGTDEVRALRDAALTGQSLRLTAPEIRLYLTDGAVERLVAVPLRGEAEAEADSTRPVALAEDFELTGDSLEVTAPQEVVDHIFAFGRARSVSHARDSLNVESLPDIARFDWLEGDTIVVTLQQPAADTLRPVEASEEERYEVERIVARVGARSLYRLAPEDSTAQVGVGPPAIHYVEGNEITIRMNEGEVEEMEVVGQTRGMHLEPLGTGPRRSPPDSAAAVPDTTGAAGGVSRTERSQPPPPDSPPTEPSNAARRP